MSDEFKQRNTSDTALRKLKTLSKISGLDIRLVTILANFTWNYDCEYGNEAKGWVKNDDLDKDAQKALSWLSEFLQLPEDFLLTQEQAQHDLINQYKKIDTRSLWNNFLRSAVSKNYSGISEFSSYHYLHGLNSVNIRELDWNKNLTILSIANKLFLKLFRGGAIDRYDLGYLWCDLTVNLTPTTTSNVEENWVPNLLSIIENLEPKSSLTDLIKACKGIISGDKYFKQEVLQGLSYAGIIEINSESISDTFTPSKRDELSSHYHSNEWTYPMRFWNSQGGKINRNAYLAFEQHCKN